MLHKCFLILTLLYLSLLTLQAQSIKINGVISDSLTGESIPFCDVYIKNTYIGVTSNIDGKYEIVYTPKGNDSIVASYLGYQDKVIPIDKSKVSQTINFAITSGRVSIKEVLITAGENPANVIVRKINKNKKYNNIDKACDNYQTELYNKVELDLDNITPEMKNMRIFKHMQFIFDNVDSTSDVTPFLPVYIAEQMYNVFHKKGKPQ